MGTSWPCGDTRHLWRSKNGYYPEFIDRTRGTREKDIGKKKEGSPRSGSYFVFSVKEEKDLITTHAG